jgi:hypothetical protein
MHTQSKKGLPNVVQANVNNVLYMLSLTLNLIKARWLMKISLVRAICMMCALNAGAVIAASDEPATKRIWACKVAPDAEEDLWLVEWGAKSYVKLYDNRLWGNFSYEGEDRRWDFDRRADGLARYSVVLKPDLSVDYYDFSNASAGDELAPAYEYECRVAD